MVDCSPIANSHTLGLTATASEMLADARTGKNVCGVRNGPQDKMRVDHGNISDFRRRLPKPTDWPETTQAWQRRTNSADFYRNERPPGDVG